MDFGPIPTSGNLSLKMRDGGTIPRQIIYIKSLAAPLLVAQTGELCERFQLAPGTIYTIGRSKKTCDIVFLDTRVSRKHCQLYLLPQNNTLTLLDGAILDNIPRMQPEAPVHEKRRRYSRRKDKNRLSQFESTVRIGTPRDVDLRLQQIRFQGFDSSLSMKEDKKRPHTAENSARIAGKSTIDKRRPGTEVPCVNAKGTTTENLSIYPGWNRSLNGIFVNGDLIDSGGCTVLSSGDEVSLVGPTKGGQSLDVNCHVAVGFMIETELPANKINSGQISVELCSAESIPSHKRKRSTFSEMLDETFVRRLEFANALSINVEDVEDKSIGNESEPSETCTYVKNKRAHIGTFVDDKHLHLCNDLLLEKTQCRELGKSPEYMIADCHSEERCFGDKAQTGYVGDELLLTPDQEKAETFIARGDGITCSFPTRVDSVASIVTEQACNTGKIGPKAFSLSSCWQSLDERLAATVTLIQESARLRSCVSDILKSSNLVNSCPCQTEWELTKGMGKQFCKRETSSRYETERASHASKESSLVSPLSLYRFAGSTDVMLSDHPMSKGIQTRCCYSSSCMPTLEKEKNALCDTTVRKCHMNIYSLLDTAYLINSNDYYLCTELISPADGNDPKVGNGASCVCNIGLDHWHKMRRSNADFHPTLPRRMLEPNRGTCSDADIILKDVQSKNQFNFTPQKGYSEVGNRASCVCNIGLDHWHKLRRSNACFHPTLPRRMLEPNRGICSDADIIIKDVQSKNQFNFTPQKGYSIFEGKNTELPVFSHLEGKELDEWRLSLRKATDDSRLSRKQLRTDFYSDLSKLTRTSMAAEIMTRYLHMHIREGTFSSVTAKYAGEVLRDNEYELALIKTSELSDQGRLQDRSAAKMTSYKEMGKRTPFNNGTSSVTFQGFLAKKRRCDFDILHISSENFPDKLTKRNSEIVQKSTVQAPADFDDICQFIVEDQIGRAEPGVVKMRLLVEENEILPCNLDHPEERNNSEPFSSPIADEMELSKDQCFCVSESIDAMKDPDTNSIDCNHINSATQQALKPSPVQNILHLFNSSRIKDNRFAKDQFVKPLGFSQVNGNTETHKRLSCALPDEETWDLSLNQVEHGEMSGRSPESLPCFALSERENVIEEVAAIAAECQPKPADSELKEMIEVGVPTLHLDCKDDNLNVEICEGRDIDPLHTEKVSRTLVNLEVTDKMRKPISCSMNDSHILLKTVLERALESKSLNYDLMQPDLDHMNSIEIATSASDVHHIYQEQIPTEKLDRSERLQVEGACVDPEICLNLMIKDQFTEIIKAAHLQEKQSILDWSYSSGYFFNKLKDVANQSSGSSSSISLKELLAPVGDLEAVFIATFTYDLAWFLSFAGFSRDVPVTVACHDADRCWSQSREDRCHKPYLDWPNVTLLYPPFPNVCAFGKGSKRQGIGCHHPKLFLLRHTSSFRVIISSANLTPRQWFGVSNNVWWQDFPFRDTSDFKTLFQGQENSDTAKAADFASQLAMFIAALVTDCPSESHWVTDLADIDFSSAAGALVTSIPGLHRPLYHNAPEFLINLEMGSSKNCQHGDSWSPKHLGIVATAVVGITYRFRASADPKGVRIRALAAILNEACTCVGLTMPVLLKRAKYVTADPNAVSVVVTSKAKSCSQDLFLQEDLHNADIHTLESFAFQSEEDFVKLGFLPRDVASWLAVLCDGGYFSFAACIWPNEALAVASGQSDGVVKLALYIFQGPRFSKLSASLLDIEGVSAICCLLKSLHRPLGLWRLEQVLSKYNWQDSEQSDFFYGSSSIGTSLDAKFLAAFAAASGRRALPSTLSQDSDPEWGCWTAGLEANDPSIGIVFPSIDRVRKDNFAQTGLLCFAESAWQRLKSANMLYDAIPCSPEREGFPMHVKVARRRFQKSPSFPPYGWIYCGSHNFSPAAWGRPSWRPTDAEAATDAGTVLGSTLHIANYEIGIILVEPPPPQGEQSFQYGLEDETARGGLDRFTMPFKVPPPKYKERDRPATGKAMYEAFMNMKALELMRGEENFAVLQSDVPLEGELNPGEADLLVPEDVNPKGEAEYVEALWSQIDSQGN